MTRSTLFWVILVVWVLFAGAASFGFGREYNVGAYANLIVLVLFALLGWQTFGPVIKSG